MNREDLPTNDAWSDWDWKELLPDLEPGGWQSLNPATTAAGDIHGAELPPVTSSDIARVVDWHADSPEGYASTDFWAIVELTDGRFAVSEAWCDTTGFDCRGGAWWKVGTYEQCLSELSESNRQQVKA